MATRMIFRRLIRKVLEVRSPQGIDDISEQQLLSPVGGGLLE
jgi:hypothetical protein